MFFVRSLYKNCSSDSHPYVTDAVCNCDKGVGLSKLARRYWASTNPKISVDCYSLETDVVFEKFGETSIDRDQRDIIDDAEISQKNCPDR